MVNSSEISICPFAKYVCLNTGANSWGIQGEGKGGGVQVATPL